MGMDKGSTKSSRFFHLFDWNKKSRKKLFSSGSVSPESTRQEKKSKDSLSRTRQRLAVDDEIFGVSSGKGSSEYSCASSVTDEDGFSLKAPGVVARLMGLDYMPTSNISEPSSTPFFDSRSLHEKQSHKRSPEFYINDQLNYKLHKIIETRSHKMPSSPIERFQTETIPPRSARSLSITHHKLLSPIKNPGFVSNKNAAYIMEAAANILDPRDQPSIKPKVSSFGSSSISLKGCDSKDTTVISQSQKRSGLQESSRASFNTNDFRNQDSNNKTNNVADTPGRGKTISLAIQAKVNVQRRVGLSLSSRSSLSQNEHEECNFSQPFKSQLNNQKNKQQKKPHANNTSGVLRQNNQKQNCTSSKGKSTLKQSMSKQSLSKQSVSQSSSTKNMTSNKIIGNSRFSHIDREASSSSSSNKDFPRKKRLIERSFIQSNVAVDEHIYSKRHEDNRSDGSDVVSFTFTSPLIKPMSENRLSRNLDKGNLCLVDNHNQMKGEYASEEKISTYGINVISSNALSLLLDKKLRELTCESEPSSSISQEPVNDCDTVDTASMEHELPPRDKHGGIFGYGISSVNCQDVEECSSSSSDARKELSSSNESYNLSESSDITDGSRTCSSSILAQNNLSFSSVNKTQYPEADTELSDSASSTITEISHASETSKSNCAKSSYHDSGYVEEILHNTFHPSILVEGTLDPLLFDKLEENERSKDKIYILRRKVLFDCANECVELKCRRYFCSGYRTWLKGVSITGNKTLGKEIYDEILGWEKMGEWMVDELVDQDMSSHFGKWLNYEIEAFEEGLDIEKEIIDSLIDEVIVDCLIKSTCI